MKFQRLVWHHAQFGNDGTGAQGQLPGQVARLFRRRRFLAAPADKEHGGRARDAVGLDDRQPMLPQCPIDFLSRAPCLRFKIDHICRAALAGYGAGELPGEAVVGLGDVLVEPLSTSVFLVRARIATARHSVNRKNDPQITAGVTNKSGRGR